MKVARPVRRGEQRKRTWNAEQRALLLPDNKRRDKLKILYWDGDGLAIWYRRLEQGTFQLPTLAEDQRSAEIRRDELMMLLRGIDFTRVCRRKRFSLTS